MAKSFHVSAQNVENFTIYFYFFIGKLYACLYSHQSAWLAQVRHLLGAAAAAGQGRPLQHGAAQADPRHGPADRPQHRSHGRCTCRGLLAHRGATGAQEKSLYV